MREAPGRSRYRTSSGRDVLRAWCAARLDEWSEPHDREEWTTSAGRTHVLIAGTGPSTVLYLAGTNFGAASSLDVAEAFCGTSRIVVPDLPGQPGLSADRPPAGRRLVGHGRWLGEVLQHVKDRVGAGPVLVVGHSLGAAVALTAPTTGVAGLMLVSPAGLVRLRVPLSVLTATVPWLARPTPGRSAGLLRELGAPGREPDRVLVESMTLVAKHTRPVVAPRPLPESVVRRWRGTPRCVITGEYDQFLPSRTLAPAVHEHLRTDWRSFLGLGTSPRTNSRPRSPPGPQHCWTTNRRLRKRRVGSAATAARGTVRRC